MAMVHKYRVPNHRFHLRNILMQLIDLAEANCLRVPRILMVV